MHTTDEIPVHIPDELTAGDTWKWKISGDHYPASDGWVWSAAFHSKNKTFIVTSTADGDDHSVTVAASTTAGYGEGHYAWQAYMTKAATSERYTVDEGILIVNADFATEPGTYDGRSHAHRVLDAIEAVIEGRASRDDASYSIAGRTLARTPLDDLLRLRDKYRAEVAAEHRADDIKHGRPVKNKIVTRFN